LVKDSRDSLYHCKLNFCMMNSQLKGWVKLKKQESDIVFFPPFIMLMDLNSNIL
jgi:hypothetical protein